MMKKILFYISVTLISLLYSGTTEAQTFSVEKSVFATGEDVKISCKDVPASAYVWVYKDLAVQPLKTMREPDKNSNGDFTGTLDMGTGLEPATYTVKCIDGKVEKGTSITFVVQEYPVVKGDKNIFVMSDIHVMSPDLLKSDGTAFQSTLNSDRKLLQYSNEIFQALKDTILKRKPDLVLITGDLTCNGEKLSHQLVVSTLDKIVKEGIKVLVIPGNHDVSNPNALYYDGDKTSKAENITADEFATLYKNYGYGDTSARDANSLSYANEPLSGLVVLGVDDNEYYNNTSSNMDSNGKIKNETLTWITEQATKARQAGKQVIMMMHHSVMPHFNDEDTYVGSSLVVEKSDSVCDLLMKAGIHTVFSGHVHITDNAMVYNTEKTDSLIDFSLGSTISYPCPYRMLTINTSANGNMLLHVNTQNIKAITSAPDLQEKSHEALAHLVNKSMISSVINSKWQTIIDAINTPGTTIHNLAKLTLGISSSDDLNTYAGFTITADTISSLVYLNLKDVATTIYFTASEGNENLKYTDDLCTPEQGVTDSIDAGGYRVIDALFAKSPAFANKIKFYYSTILGSYIDNFALSMLRDGNNFDLNTFTSACVVNDLYGDFVFSASKATGINAVTDRDAGYLNVYPLITSGDITITATEEYAGKPLIIVDETGRLIFSRTLVGGDHFSYSFNHSGMYIVKAVGTNGYKKVIVK